jgi:hypothetical protein
MKMNNVLTAKSNIKLPTMGISKTVTARKMIVNTFIKESRT